MPLLSVVIPTFNSIRWLEETVLSVLGQDHDELEVVVSDQSSTDGTWELLQQWRADPRVRLHQAPGGTGAAANWNAGTAAARGDLLRLVCADDVLAPGTLARHASLLASDPSLVLVSGRRRVVDDRGRTILRPGRPVSGKRTGRDAVRLGVATGTNVFGEPFAVTVRRQVLHQVGGWDARHRFLLDLDTWTRVSAQGSVLFDDEVAGSFRVSPEQWSAQLAAEQSQEWDAYVARLAADPAFGLGKVDLLRSRARARSRAAARRLVYVGLRARARSLAVAGDR